MVEGPKVWLKCERLKVLETLRLKKYAIQKKEEEQLVVQDSSTDEQLQSVCCVGKELFLLFANKKMMRFHFGMNGSERIINAESPPPELPAYSRKAMTCILYFDLKTLYLYDTTVSISTYNPIEFATTLDAKLSRDIMSPTFESNVVVQLLASDHRPIMDGMLDQHIMPGVGNIIKCEGLFLSHLNPNQVASSLPVDRLNELIQHLKDFSWRWYESSKRNNGDIYKVIYGRSTCSICHGIVTLVRSGQTHRITYYCNHCQPVMTTPTTTHSQQVYSIEAIDENIPPWECAVCSGHNVSAAPICIICEGPRPVPAAVSSNSINQKQQQSLVQQDPQQEPQQSTIQQLRCKCSQPATLNRVRKSGPTQHRLFWSCSQKASKSKKKSGCDFFHWADLRFPKCSQHPKGYTVMRRVLKAGPNNGRCFFSCSIDKCEFFVWESEFAKTLIRASADTESGSTTILTCKKRPFDEAFVYIQYPAIPL